jgi:predicted membrane channel-forming protein YqfA (hemolysin III family)
MHWRSLAILHGNAAENGLPRSHAIGVCLGAIGAVAILASSARMEGLAGTILIYVIGLVATLALSAAYNMWPLTPAKWILRRFDHSASDAVRRRRPSSEHGSCR